jgi:hypothetical protein
LIEHHDGVLRCFGITAQGTRMLEYVLVSFLKNSLAFVAVVSMLALAPQPVFAETIYQAMAKAYENNPDLNAARAGLRATDEGVALAKSGYRPFIGAEATTTSTNASEGRVTNSASVGVSITQTLFDGFQTRNNVRAAEAAVFAGRENLRGTEIDILLAAPYRPMPTSTATTRSSSTASRTLRSFKSSSLLRGPASMSERARART